jgi:hypothetical protein
VLQRRAIGSKIQQEKQFLVGRSLLDFAFGQKCGAFAFDSSFQTHLALVSFSFLTALGMVTHCGHFSLILNGF